MDKCVISVVVPCYNVQGYTAETLQSLSEQTFQDFEIICFDDGSTDDTFAILEMFSGNHANMAVVRETNHWQDYESNQGAGMSSGKYIYNMESDDLLVPECFQKIYEICENNMLYRKNEKIQDKLSAVIEEDAEKDLQKFRDYYLSFGISAEPLDLSKEVFLSVEDICKEYRISKEMIKKTQKELIKYFPFG